MGDSAGGQIVALMGLTANTTRFNVGQNSDVSSSVQAVVDLFGPTDLITPDWSTSAVVQGVAPKVFGTTLGPDQPDPAIKQELVEASPVSYVASGEPPFLIMQGTADTVVPPDQSADLAYELKADGDSVTLVMVQGAQHEFAPESNEKPSASISELVLEAAAFLVKDLQPPS
jgi:acetyl esterase/lipase